MRFPLAALALAAGASAQAQSTNAAVERVVITGSPTEQRLFDTPYAIGTIDASDLRSAGPMVNLSEALVRVPGIVVNDRSNYAQDLQISSRGFGARTSFGVRGLRLYADGIPASGPDGQGQVASFDLAGAARIEVLRGPFSALYGNSSGGVIALVTAAPKQREFTLDVDLGSNGLRQTRVGIAAPLAAGFDIRASASQFDTDGSRTFSSASRTLGNVRLGWQGERDQVVAVLNSIDQPAQDPLGLTRSQLDADPGQTTPQAMQFDTRKIARQTQAGVSWRHRFEASGVGLVSSSVAAWSGNRSVTQWQSIPVATQTPARHPGGVIDFDRSYDGVDARLVWGGSNLRMVTGATVERQRDDRRGYENFIGTGPAQQLGVTGRLRRDEDNRATTRDVYAQAEVDLGSQLVASAGVRKGSLHVQSTDRYLSNGDDSGTRDFDYTNPVLALRWQPDTRLSLYASVGRGYESPTLNELAYRNDGGAGLNPGLAAQRSRQVEVGIKWRPASSTFSVDAAVFEARTSDEIGVQSNSGGRSTFSNVGRTQRTGAEVDLHWKPATHWRSQLALTWLRATYSDSFLTCAVTPCTTPSAPVSAGNRIAGTVPIRVYAELAWSLNPNTELGVEARMQGRQPVNDRNTDFAGGAGVVGLRLQHRLTIGPGTLALLGRIDNIADRRYVGTVIVNDGNSRFFEPAPRRAYLLSARWSQPY